jgi:hypothetical protein
VWAFAIDKGFRVRSFSLAAILTVTGVAEHAREEA